MKDVHMQIFINICLLAEVAVVRMFCFLWFFPPNIFISADVGSSCGLGELDFSDQF